MCDFKSRVHSCGHYKTTLWNPCDNAKNDKTPCDVDSSSEDSSTTAGLCYLSASSDIVADGLTKPLTAALHSKFIEQLRMKVIEL